MNAMAHWLTPADLDPELAEVLVEGGPFGQMIKHPLVNEVFYMPEHNTRYNEALQAKRAAVEKMAEEGDWSSYVFLHERPWRLSALLDIADDLRDEEFWSLVGQVWTDSENIWQNIDEWSELLRDRRPRHEAMMDDEERAVLAALPDVITVYRGHGDENGHGWSWTIDRDKAVWFANRLRHEDEEAYLTEGQVRRDDVLAYFAGRGEGEIVIDPDLVEYVEPMLLPEQESV